MLTLEQRMNAKPKIVLTINANQDPVYGYEGEYFTVFNPRMSECGRFTVDPMEAYGVTEAQADALHALNVAHGYDDETV